MSDKVIAYTNPTCPHCRRLKEYLLQHHIAFENKDVANDQNAAMEFQLLNAPGVPVVQVGDDMLVGFDQGRLEELLKTHGVAA